MRMSLRPSTEWCHSWSKRPLLLVLARRCAGKFSCYAPSIYSTWKTKLDPQSWAFVFSKDLLNGFHQPLGVCDVKTCRSCRPNWDVRCIQTFWVNGHSRQRCVSVSADRLHSWHNGLCGHTRLARLLAVRILCCSRIQAKILHLGSARAFQIGVVAGFLCRPTNCIRYALCVVYWPSIVHLHLISSSESSNRLIVVSFSQSSMNWWSSSLDYIGEMWETHLFSAMAFITAILFLLVLLNKARVA
jgi:hypothetical protein